MSSKVAMMLNYEVMLSRENEKNSISNSMELSPS
jgi:hypothetical protein